MTLNLKKCKFVKNCIDLFGHVNQPGPLEVLTGRVAVICGLEHVTNVMEILSFSVYSALCKCSRLILLR